MQCLSVKLLILAPGDLAKDQVAAIDQDGPQGAPGAGLAKGANVATERAPRAAQPVPNNPVPRRDRETRATGIEPRGAGGVAEGAAGQSGTETNVARQPMTGVGNVSGANAKSAYGITEAMSHDAIRQWQKP